MSPHQVKEWTSGVHQKSRFFPFRHEIFIVSLCGFLHAFFYHHPFCYDFSFSYVVVVVCHYLLLDLLKTALRRKEKFPLPFVRKLFAFCITREWKNDRAECPKNFGGKTRGFIRERQLITNNLQPSRPFSWLRFVFFFFCLLCCPSFVNLC